jgi:hypothetical protein
LTARTSAAIAAPAKMTQNVRRDRQIALTPSGFC